MLTVQGHRRHHLTSPSHFSSTHYLDSLPLSTNPSSPSALNEKLLRSYLLSSSNIAGSTEDLVDAFNFDPEAFMTGAFAYSNPAIRIQQSTPVSQLPLDYEQQTSMLATEAGATERNWNMFGGSALVGNPALQVQYNNRRAHPHQRAASSSSIGSTTSAPHYPSHTTATTDFSYSGITDTSPPASSVNKVDSSYSTADQPASHFSNHLPTPSQTPTSESFLNPTTYQNFAPQGSSTYGNAMAAHFAMKQAMMDTDEEVPGYAHSSRQSVSSYGNNSPATPRTVVGDDFEDKYKTPNGENFFSDKVESWMDEYLRFDDEPDMMSTDVPKMDGATSEAFQAIYGQPALSRIHTQHSSQHAKNSLLSPYRSVMAERLQAAQIARSQSPTSSASRGVSPFRQGSPLAPVNNSFGSPRQRFVPTQMRDQQASEAAVKAFALKPMQPSQTESKTISPKDAMLEFNESEEDSKMPLFPPDESQKYSHQYGNANVFPNFDTSSEHSYGSMATSRADSWVDTQPFYATAADNTQSFNFVPPSIPGSLPINNGISFSSQQFRPTSVPTPHDSTPEFPAHLTSMDSSASEAGGPMDSDSIHDLKKPGSSAAGTGTYSCTYHGCPLRFETPQKLQKHKREGHRQNPTAITTGVGSGMSAAELLARNSQAGPHKCERINPTTGKPCNTIFSRPYDLTRHEDTIHNARKQKVRCALCVEEKTFSRNDALTRHMRVVHPEVDFPGKHRRRGQSHE